MTLRVLAGLALGLALASPGSAQSPAAAVAQARAAGLVGERYDGYLGIAAAPVGPLLRHQVAAVNIRRRALYADLATRRGVTVQEVGITAACQLLGTVAEGERYLLNGDQWRARREGDAAPVPDYCR